MVKAREFDRVGVRSKYLYKRVGFGCWFWVDFVPKAVVQNRVFPNLRFHRIALPVRAISPLFPPVFTPKRVKEEGKRGR